MVIVTLKDRESEIKVFPPKTHAKPHPHPHRLQMRAKNSKTKFNLDLNSLQTKNQNLPQWIMFVDSRPRPNPLAWVLPTWLESVGPDSTRKLGRKILAVFPSVLQRRQVLTFLFLFIYLFALRVKHLPVITNILDLSNDCWAWKSKAISTWSHALSSQPIRCKTYQPITSWSPAFSRASDGWIILPLTSQWFVWTCA